MKPEFENIPLVKAPQQYEIEIDGSKAFITYRESNSTITLLHTEVEPALQGMGCVYSCNRENISSNRRKW